MRGWFGDGSGGVSWPRVLLCVLGLAVALAVGVGAATTDDPLHPNNYGWDGTSDATSEFDLEPVTATADLTAKDPESTTLVISAPEDPMTDGIATFVEEGGTLVVLENFGGGGNEVLEAAGADARIDGWLLRDEDSYGAGPNMPIAPTVTDHERTAGVETLELNYASVVEANGAETLVASSDVAYTIPEPEADVDETATDPEQRPVATVEAVGDGEVIAGSDPSIAINEMVDAGDNRAFLEGVTDTDHALVDLRHGQSVPPLVAATGMLEREPLLLSLVGLIGVGLVAAATNGRIRSSLTPRGGSERTQPPRPPTEAMVDAVCADHPEWDRDRVERVMTAFNHTREQEIKE